MGLTSLCISRRDNLKQVRDDLHRSIQKLDLRSKSGHDPIVGGGNGHVAYQTTRLGQASSLVPLTSL